MASAESGVRLPGGHEARYVAVHIDKRESSGRARKTLAAALVFCAVALGIALLAGQQDSDDGAPSSSFGLAMKKLAGAPAKRAAKEQALSDFSDPPSGTFTGRYHTESGTPLTFGNNTFYNVFDPNPEPTCDPGSTGTDGECTPCAANRYCPGGQMDIECAPHAISFSDSFRKSQCTCEPGYFGPNGGPCAICPADSWCPGGTDTFPCPTHSSSGEGVFQCTCDPGFKGPDHDSCEVCAAGSFCLGGNQAQQCSANSWTVEGVASADLCGCVKDFYEFSRTNPANGPDCSVCTVDHYCAGGPPGLAQTACPALTESSARSGDLADCTCIAGYFGTAASACTKCEKGYYCPGGANPIACPVNTNSEEGVSAVGQCACNPGFYGADGGNACQMCPAGYQCPGGGGILSCPAMETSLAQAHKCYCSPGYVTKVKTTGAAGGGELCHRNQYCPGGSAEMPCPPNTQDSFGAGAQTQCICSPGYSGSGGADCNLCAPNNFCARPGQPAKTCPANADGPEGSASAARCTCRAGFRNVREKQNMNAFTGPECVNCRAGYFCPAGGAEVACPAHMTSPVGSISMGHCVAAPGYILDDTGNPTECPAGFYCVGGSAGQAACPTRSRSNAGASELSGCRCNAGWFGSDPTKCATCPYNSVCTGGSNIVSCKANAGPNSDATACTCNAGYYSSNPRYCRQCRANQYCPGGSASVACPAGAGSSPGSRSEAACMCKAGKYAKDGECANCQAGYYCLAQRPKMKCPPHKTSVEGAYDVGFCTTKPGYYDTNFMPPHDFTWRFEGEVQITQRGRYTFCTSSDDGSLLYLNDKLVDNNDGLHGSSEVCGGRELQAGAVKVRCDGFERGGGVSEQVMYWGPDTGNQREYPHSVKAGPDGYKGWKMSIFKSDRRYSRVPAIPGSLNFLGSNWVDQIDVTPAYGPAKFGRLFTPTASECQGGYFCLGRTARWARFQYASRRSCSGGLTTAPGMTGAVSRDDCDQCAAGTYKSGNSCRRCPWHSYCPGGNSPAVVCPDGSKTAATGQSEAGQCVCERGQEIKPGGMSYECQPCSKGFICPHKGGRRRAACPEGSTTTITGATHYNSCRCNEGYKGTSGRCEICRSRYWCPGGSSQRYCGSAASSPAGSKTYSDCVCNAGEKPYFQIQDYQPSCVTYQCRNRNRCAAEKICNNDENCLGYTAARGGISGQTCLVSADHTGDAKCVDDRKSGDNSKWSFFKRIEFRKLTGPGETFFKVATGQWRDVQRRCTSYGGVVASIHNDQDALKSAAVCRGDCAQWRNGRCYSKRFDAAKWNDAQGTCAKWGGKVMSLRDDQDLEIAKRFMGSNYYWLGMERSGNPNGEAKHDFTFLDGTNNGYAMGKWRSNEPREAGSREKNCVVAARNLMVETCTSRHPFICSRDDADIKVGSDYTGPCYIGMDRKSTRSPWRNKDNSKMDFTLWDKDQPEAHETKTVFTAADGGSWHDWGTGYKRFPGVCRTVRGDDKR